MGRKSKIAAVVLGISALYLQQAYLLMKFLR